MTSTVPESATTPPGPDEVGFSCPHCGSSQLRRSAPKGPIEKLLRAFSPVHFYRCRACGRRGAHWGRIPGAGHGGRPVETRDLRLRRKRRARMVVSVAVAIALGVASGLYVHGCEQSAENTAAPGQ